MFPNISRCKSGNSQKERFPLPFPISFGSPIISRYRSRCMSLMEGGNASISPSSSRKRRERDGFCPWVTPIHPSAGFGATVAPPSSLPTNPFLPFISPRRKIGFCSSIRPCLPSTPSPLLPRSPGPFLIVRVPWRSLASLCMALPLLRAPGARVRGARLRLRREDSEEGAVNNAHLAVLHSDSGCRLAPFLGGGMAAAARLIPA